MELSHFNEKLNKVEGKTYVIEEEIIMPSSKIYEAALRHDNINEKTLSVYTGSKLTGEKIQSYSISTPSLTPWKKVIRIQTAVPIVYISYETDGDTVEADDINSLQETITKTQVAVNEEEERAGLREAELQSDMDTHKLLMSAKLQELKEADQDLEERKANFVDVYRELENRYTKEEVYTKEEISAKIVDSDYVHPDSGVIGGTYRVVTVDEQGHVTAGDNPTTLEGYGILDGAAKDHDHDSMYFKKGALVWADMKGG